MYDRLIPLIEALSEQLEAAQGEFCARLRCGRSVLTEDERALAGEVAEGLMRKISDLEQLTKIISAYGDD